ncbi:hypothetical protein J6590_093203 [Homalodisca vitripennis]|nr:hypothetical protein J6590_019537 [Homalodisca vitripennis]KAG8275138.1 hypothetical protein J6590_093203 [Homalodisca vitripennis]
MKPRGVLLCGGGGLRRRRKERSRSRSRCSIRSPTVSPKRPREFPDKRRGNKAARTRESTPAPTDSKGTYAPRPQHPPTRLQHPPKATDIVTNEMLETMRNHKPDSASRAASLVSESATHKRPRPPLDLERFVLDPLRGKELCTKKITAM